MNNKDQQPVPSPLQPGVQPGAAGPKETDWDKIVSEREGTFHLPKQFEKEAEEIEKKREEFNSHVAEMAEREITLNMATQNLFFSLRKHFAAEGIDVWTKEIGLDPEALKAGKRVINMTESQR